MAEIILPLADTAATLETVGGKGASLAIMKRSGLPVPEGFHVTTQAYLDFAAANRLQKVITGALKEAEVLLPQTLEDASRVIQIAFLEAEIPPRVEAAIREAYKAMGKPEPALAVRSSATAEDLPEASFAGQQETYLNVRGEAETLEAVRKCWASLWTARAIGYRLKNKIDQGAIALAVVVQELVAADSAGVLFSANPLNGRRDEVLINAAWGLGEALVSGRVSPDSITADKRSGTVKHMQAGDKTRISVPMASGVEERRVSGARRKGKVLNAKQVAELVSLAREIEALFGQPQDIEWCSRAGGIYIVQSRPITNLPDAPAENAWALPNPKVSYIRGSLAEHLPNPVSPLFGTLGLRAINASTAELAEMMKMDLQGSNYQYLLLNGYVYMGYQLNAKLVWSMIGVTINSYKMMLVQGSERWQAARREFSERIAKWKVKALQQMSATEILKGARELMYAAGKYYTVIQSGTLPSASSSEMVFSGAYKMVKDKDDPEASTLLLGLDSVALRAEKSLFDLGRWVSEHPALQDYATNTPAEAQAEQLQTENAPEKVSRADWAEFRQRVKGHLETYGETSYDFDFMNPSPAEMPEVLLESLKMYAQGKGGDPYRREREAEEARQGVLQKVRQKRTLLPRRWFEKVLKWALKCSPAREDSLADMGMGHAQVRRLLGEAGRRLAEKGAIPTAGDIYWLTEDELEQAAALLDEGKALPEYTEAVAGRRRERQAQLRMFPPAVLPETSVFARMIPWSRQNSGVNVIRGMAASGGCVTAPARVLFGPEDFSRMQAGDVLVAVTTTPAWTPLFSMAAAVVTDIGGPLSHSSIVAREYGIPAVLATGSGTRRIQDGQLITVDGKAGTVTLKQA